MRLTLRNKLTALVTATGFTFVLLIVAGAYNLQQVQSQLTAVERQYIPKVELRPKLGADFEHLQRAFQDAVAAQDLDVLARSTQFRDELFQRLAAAGAAVEHSRAEALRTAIDDYYTTAYDVSRRLIAGETGEQLVASIAEMQAKQAEVARLLDESTSFDRKALQDAFATIRSSQVEAAQVRLIISIACLLLISAISWGMSRGIFRSLGILTTGFDRFGRGEFGSRITIPDDDELGDVARRANEMAHNLEQLNEQRQRTDWLKNGLVGLSSELRGELEPFEAGSRAIQYLCRYLDVPAAALYRQTAKRLDLVAHYAGSGEVGDVGPARSFQVGEGLVGQAVRSEDVTVVTNVPADYLYIRSGLGEAVPSTLVFVPLVHVGGITGVLEFAVLREWRPVDTEFVLSMRETLAIGLAVSHARADMRKLLLDAQELAHQLSMQEEELRSTNEELQSQQEELRQTNEELAEQAEELDAQRHTLQQKNQELDEARLRLEEKARDLTAVSAYKSQFLANMSHELRTPLNSMLLLSSLLADNDDGNLTAKQVEYCNTVHAAGNDLLALINQVLDLAKIESGKQELRTSPVEMAKIVEHMQHIFGPLARDKKLSFDVSVDPKLPQTIVTDRQRLEQILNNLLGNAIKFTSKGGVSLRIHSPDPAIKLQNSNLDLRRAVAFTVSDTGVGIAEKDQARVFSPFEQAESSTDRRFGGTGLGLTISRELSALFGGELTVSSAVGKGSTFTCYLPLDVGADGTNHHRTPPPASPPTAATSVGRPGSHSVKDNRDVLRPGEPCLLIIEDDAVFATIFSDFIGAQGIKYLVAGDAESGIALAKKHQPAGIILDVMLPDLDGWTVMERLRNDPATAAIPVHFVSAVPGNERGLSMGAVGYVTKPVVRQDLMRIVDALVPSHGVGSTPKVLIVEADPKTADSIFHILEGERLEATRVTNAHEALAAVTKEKYGCMILDLSLPDMDGLEFLRALEAAQGGSKLSVIVYTGRALTKAETQRLEAYTEAIVLKEGSSVERLLDEVRLFVQRLREGFMPHKARARLHPADVKLTGRRLLIVDDDMRTVYALSAMLRAKGVDVVVADTGKAALEALDARKDIEAVLMDIMMPEMDGYEAMRKIRANRRFATLPIIALTAKAMKGDEEKCIEAGASAYLSKPIDAERLLSLLQSHLPEGKPGGKS